MVFGKFGLDSTSVGNSRYFKRSNIIWRRRKQEDGFVFTTRESVDLGTLGVLKKDGATEAYMPAKLLVSLLGSTDHLESSKNDSWHLLQTIETKFLEYLDDDMMIESEIIAQICMETLKNFNSAAHVKYASFQTDLRNKRDLRHLIQ